jgi:hypothetical protein
MSLRHYVFLSIFLLTKNPVDRYFCFGLLGLSGIVNSKKPHFISGFKISCINFVLFFLPDIFISAKDVLSGWHFFKILTWSELIFL